MKGFTGSIQGSFRFENMDNTNEYIDAMIGEFVLKPDNDSVFLRYNYKN